MMVPLIGKVDRFLGLPGERIAIEGSRTERRLGRPQCVSFDNFHLNFAVCCWVPEWPGNY